MIIEMAHRLMK